MRLIRWRSLPAVILSSSLNAQTKGRSKAASTSQAARFGAASGSSGDVGTRVGNCRAPSLYVSSGNGASYAAITSSLRSVVHPPLMIRPIGISGTSCENFCQARNASPGFPSPVGRKVLAATTPAKRSGWAATSRSPSSPPQSWHTRVMSRRSSASNTCEREPADVAGVGVVGALARLVGASEADEVGSHRAEPGVDQRPGSCGGRGSSSSARRGAGAPPARRGHPRRRGARAASPPSPSGMSV